MQQTRTLGKFQVTDLRAALTACCFFFVLTVGVWRGDVGQLIENGSIALQSRLTSQPAEIVAGWIRGLK